MGNFVRNILTKYKMIKNVFNLFKARRLEFRNNVYLFAQDAHRMVQCGMKCEHRSAAYIWYVSGEAQYFARNVPFCECLLVFEALEEAFY